MADDPETIDTYADLEAEVTQSCQFETLAAVYDSFTSLGVLAVRCNICCDGKCSSYHCPLCPVDRFKPTKLNKLQSHLQLHWKSRVEARNGLYAVRCCLPHGQMLRTSHYHCPTCAKIVMRKLKLIGHIQRWCPTPVSHGENRKRKSGSNYSTTVGDVDRNSPEQNSTVLTKVDRWKQDSSLCFPASNCVVLREDGTEDQLSGLDNDRYPGDYEQINSQSHNTTVHLSSPRSNHSSQIYQRRARDQPSGSYYPSSIVNATTVNELILKVRIADAEERDFIEVSIPLERGLDSPSISLRRRLDCSSLRLERGMDSKLTFDLVLSTICIELGVERDRVIKLRKLPDTIVRNDSDVQRFVDFQELELVVRT